ncbi:MAG: PhoH family protein [Paludibacteraceae bacterium]|nr:PhoH family protein [Paludibacteraceae bacterium]
MSEKLIQLPDVLDTQSFYGVNNQNMLCLKNLFPKVKIVARGYNMKITGSEEDISSFEALVNKAAKHCIDHGSLSEKQLSDIYSGSVPALAHTDKNLILFGVQGKPILARTVNQQRLVSAIDDNDLLFAIGPAGSGKTYTAIALAVRALKNRQVRKIVLSRPAVEAGEKLGFLPGDMREKIDPYLQPLYDALEDMLPEQKLREYMDRGVIQIAPLAFMRGRTLNDAVVILDEAQNTTIQQIKMFLTRLGMGSKMIVTGDLTQVDLPQQQKSGLRDAVEKLDRVEGVSIIHFNEKDIVRHPLVTRIIKAYDKE